MNRILRPLFLVLVCASCTARAAQLSWDPSSTAGGAPPAVMYVIQSAPVGNPQLAPWAPLGTTAGTAVILTNNAYLMYRVLGVSAGGQTSDPSNVVTNGTGKPNPPGNAIIGAVIESAPTPSGPFTIEQEVAIDVAMVTNRFYRSRVTIARTD